MPKGGYSDVDGEKISGGVYRDSLVGFWWLWKRRVCRGFYFRPPDNIHLGIGFTGVAIAFGLTLLTMVYTIGPISGCHINPAVSIGLWAGNRFPASQLLPYIIAQVLGGILGAFILYVIATGKVGFDVVASGFAANGFGEHSPGKYSFWRRWCLRWS